MTARPRTKTMRKDTENGIIRTQYTPSQSPLDFYISEERVSYGKQKPFTLYYDDAEHSVRLLKGNCVETLNQARENSVDMIFADPPYFLSNETYTCQNGKRVSVRKGEWDLCNGLKNGFGFYP